MATYQSEARLNMNMQIAEKLETHSVLVIQLLGSWLSIWLEYMSMTASLKLMAPSG